jgi:hypothetical protein
MTRVWNTPVFIIATVYFVVDGVFSHVTRPITVWLARKKLLKRARLWITSLRPYPSLALFAVPVIILEPAKPLGEITRHSNQVPRLNLRSGRGTAGAPLPAISCLGAFRTPAAAPRG